MKRSFFNLKENIFIHRIFDIRNSIISYSFASFLDIILILIISSIFKKIIEISFYSEVYFFVIQCLILVLLRTIFVFLLRKYSFRKIFDKKLKDEEFLVRNFIEERIYYLDDNNKLNLFKEKLINSCNLAAVNFDIPITSICAELIFAIGGIFILFKIFGVGLFLYNLPILTILVIASKFLSKKLHKLGIIIINSTEKRLNSIDNISEISFEVSSMKESSKLVDYFSKINNPYNKILSQQIITSNMTQIFTESSAFIIILITLVAIILNTSSMSLTNSATSLAILSRMIPSFTRSIAFFTQLQFGVPCVRRLSKLENYDL
tara:strand:+ start:535 stop:1494 length:960 start_codon:yes stop_codon:yes gene_type:complete